jgi:predicted RNA-binding Zn-ribbon protein involved in translation (DUF1610 family)
MIKNFLLTLKDFIHKGKNMKTVSAICEKCGYVYKTTNATIYFVCPKCKHGNSLKKDENLEEDIKKYQNSGENCNMKKNMYYYDNMNGGVFVNKKQNNNDDDFSWESDIKIIEKCSKVPENADVWLMPLVKTKIDVLMKRFKSCEWLAYLIGEKNQKEKLFVVKDLFIPKQKATSTMVKNIECPEFNKINCIGVIHSHHGMGSQFSHTDDEWINQNHDISLCISHKKIEGHVRWKTPCGEYTLVNATTKLKLDVDLNVENFLKEIDEKINKKEENIKKVPKIIKKKEKKEKEKEEEENDSSLEEELERLEMDIQKNIDQKTYKFR